MDGDIVGLVHGTLKSDLFQRKRTKKCLIVVLKRPKFTTCGSKFNSSAPRHCKITVFIYRFQEEMFLKEMCTSKSQ